LRCETEPAAAAAPAAGASGDGVPRLYVAQRLVGGSSLLLSEAPQRHYLLRVLRLRPGAPLRLFDGSGGAWRARIAAVRQSGVELAVGGFLPGERESPLRLRLLQGVCRGRRMDYALQKAVELGVWRIVPALTRRCGAHLAGARLRTRMAHWRGIVVAACEQCGRNRVPEIEAPVPLPELLAREAPLTGIYFAPGAARSLADLPPPGARMRMNILLGPEGGLSGEENAAAAAAGLAPVALGPRVLRAETATAAALSACQVLWGDLAAPQSAAQSVPQSAVESAAASPHRRRAGGQGGERTAVAPDPAGVGGARP